MLTSTSPKLLPLIFLFNILTSSIFADLIAYKYNDKINNTGIRYQATVAQFGMQIKEDQTIPGFLIVAKEKQVAKSADQEENINENKSNTTSIRDESSLAEAASILSDVLENRNKPLTYEEYQKLKQTYENFKEFNEINAADACNEIVHKKDIVWRTSGDLMDDLDHKDETDSTQDEPPIQIEGVFADMDMNYKLRSHTLLSDLTKGKDPYRSIQALDNYPINFFVNKDSTHSSFLVSIWNYFTEVRTGQSIQDSDSGYDPDPDFTIKPVTVKYGVPRYPAKITKSGQIKPLTNTRPVILSNIKNVFVLVQRGNCSFAKKVMNAQNAGYDGVIVYDPISDASISMNAHRGDDGVDPREIEIPSVFVGRKIANILYENYIYKQNETLARARASRHNKNNNAYILDLAAQPFILLVSDDNSIIDYLKNPTTFDGMKDISETHPSIKGADVWPRMRSMKQQDLYDMAAYILFQNFAIPERWGGGKQYY